MNNKSSRNKNKNCRTILEKYSYFNRIKKLLSNELKLFFKRAYEFSFNKLSKRSEEFKEARGIAFSQREIRGAYVFGVKRQNCFWLLRHVQIRKEQASARKRVIERKIEARQVNIHIYITNCITGCTTYIYIYVRARKRFPICYDVTLYLSWKVD